MKAVVNVIGYVRLSELVGGGILPMVVDDGDTYWIIEENGDIGCKNESIVAEVIYAKRA